VFNIFVQPTTLMLLCLIYGRLELHLELKLMIRCHSMSIMSTLVQIILFMLPLATWKIRIPSSYLRKYGLSSLIIFQSFSMHRVSNFRKDHLILSFWRYPLLIFYEDEIGDIDSNCSPKSQLRSYSLTTWAYRLNFFSC